MHVFNVKVNAIIRDPFSKGEGAIFLLQVLQYPAITIQHDGTSRSYGVHYLENSRPNHEPNMNLDELLSFKPQKKRSLAEEDVREDEKPPSSKRRGILAAGNGSVSRNNRGADRDGPPLPLGGGLGGGGGASGGGTGAGEFNGVSEEEKLRILQSLEDDEEDTG
jgi:hypothetical protein